jgi:hypothetical protein
MSEREVVGLNLDRCKVCKNREKCCYHSVGVWLTGEDLLGLTKKIAIFLLFFYDF